MWILYTLLAITSLSLIMWAIAGQHLNIILATQSRSFHNRSKAQLRTTHIKINRFAYAIAVIGLAIFSFISYMAIFL